MVASSVPEPAHVCWHRLVAQHGIHLYYECRCGSRTHGVAANSKKHATKDEAWLAGGPGQPS